MSEDEREYNKKMVKPDPRAESLAKKIATPELTALSAEQFWENWPDKEYLPMNAIPFAEAYARQRLQDSQTREQVRAALSRSQGDTGEKPAKV